MDLLVDPVALAAEHRLTLARRVPARHGALPSAPTGSRAGRGRRGPRPGPAVRLLRRGQGTSSSPPGGASSASADACAGSDYVCGTSGTSLQLARVLPSGSGRSRSRRPVPWSRASGSRSARVHDTRRRSSPTPTDLDSRVHELPRCGRNDPPVPRWNRRCWATVSAFIDRDDGCRHACRARSRRVLDRRRQGALASSIGVVLQDPQGDLGVSGTLRQVPDPDRRLPVAVVDLEPVLARQGVLTGQIPEARRLQPVCASWRSMYR